MVGVNKGFMFREWFLGNSNSFFKYIGLGLLGRFSLYFIFFVSIFYFNI